MSRLILRPRALFQPSRVSPSFASRPRNCSKSYRAGEDAAVAEVERFERRPDPAQFALADAQRVLARAYGFASWTNLKQHVEGVNVAAFCAAVEAGDVATVRRLAKARPELVHVERGGGFGEMTRCTRRAQSRRGNDPRLDGTGRRCAAGHLAASRRDDGVHHRQGARIRRDRGDHRAGEEAPPQGN